VQMIGCQQQIQPVAAIQRHAACNDGEEHCS
jgi:hypothetical protein